MGNKIIAEIVEYDEEEGMKVGTRCGDPHDAQD